MKLRFIRPPRAAAEDDEQLVRPLGRVGKGEFDVDPDLPAARRGDRRRLGDERSVGRVEPQLDRAAGAAGGDAEGEPPDALEVERLVGDVVAVLDEADVQAAALAGRPSSPSGRRGRRRRARPARGRSS